jgi:hypothetical protein
MRIAIMNRLTAKEWIAVWALRGFKFNTRTGPYVYHNGQPSFDEGTQLMHEVWKDLEGAPWPHVARRNLDTYAWETQEWVRLWHKQARDRGDE